MIEKGLIRREEFMQMISEERVHRNDHWRNNWLEAALEQFREIDVDFGGEGKETE